VYMAGHMMN